MMDPKVVVPFGFPGENELWDAVHAQLETFIESEVATVLDPGVQGEMRAYMAGKAAALGEFRDHLKALRELARNQKE